MPQFSVVTPFENITDETEQRALALADHLVPILDKWRAAEDLRERRNTLKKEIDQTNLEKEGLLPRAESQRLQLNSVYGDYKSYGLPALGLLIVGLGLLFVNSMVGIVAAIAGFGWALKSAAGKKKTLAEQLRDTEKKIAELDSDVTQKHQSLSSLDNEINARAIKFPKVKIGRFRFNLKHLKIGDSNLIVDVAGMHAPQSLILADTSQLKENITFISDRVESLLSVPPLLMPRVDQELDDPIHELFGEEESLQDLVGEFTEALGKIKDVTLNAQLVSPGSTVGRRILQGDLNPSVFDAIEFRDSTKLNADDLNRFLTAMIKVKSDGQQVVSELRQVYEALEQACSLYANARTDSTNLVHEHLISVLNRASWCGRRFFCPRSIVSPDYIQDMIGVPIASAHLLSLDDLLSRLSTDEEIRKRLSSKPEIEKQLSEAYLNVQDLSVGVEFDSNGNRIQGTTARPRYLEDQLEESLKIFRNSLNRALTGSTYPILNFSREAQVFYDPESEEWGSETTPYVYRTPDILKYGSVIKAHSDLLIPLWEHLWTEKADFRKSELFRTNESLILMGEKESEKLIEVGNQFRADLRTVRENIYRLESELHSKHSEILGFRDGMIALNLLSERAKQNVSDEKLRELVAVEFSMPAAQRYESMLGSLPQAQAEARGTVHDPIEEVKNPGVLIGYEAITLPRLQHNQGA